MEKEDWAVVFYQDTALVLIQAGGLDFRCWETKSNTGGKYAEHLRGNNDKRVLGERMVHNFPSSEDANKVLSCAFSSSLSILWRFSIVFIP